MENEIKFSQKIIFGFFNQVQDEEVMQMEDSRLKESKNTVSSKLKFFDDFMIQQQKNLHEVSTSIKKVVGHETLAADQRTLVPRTATQHAQ